MTDRGVTFLRGTRGATAAVALSAIAFGCGGGAIPRASVPETPGHLTKCQVAASHQNPLVTEWPASEKANLEVRLRQGGVVVAYSGCEMRLLEQCPIPGAYVWQRTTISRDAIEIRSEDDLYAKLPLGAASLAGELRTSGRLAMQTTVAGQLRLTGVTPGQVPITGPCQGATHLVGALSVGAFKLKSGGALAGRAGVGIGNAEIGAGTTSEESLLREAGSADGCSGSTDEAPHADCRSPIQMFLWPLPWIQQQQGPPGTVKVDFVAGDADTVWNVLAGGQVLCTTPCSQWMPPSTPLILREPESSFFDPAESVEVPDLRKHSAEGPLEVRAETSSFGLWATGVTLTSLSGMAAVAGIVMLAVGCPSTRDGSMNEPGLCTAGAVTGPIGVAGLVPSIWLILAAGAHAEVLPGQHLAPRAVSRPPELRWSAWTGGLGGQF